MDSYESVFLLPQKKAVIDFNYTILELLDR